MQSPANNPPQEYGRVGEDQISPIRCDNADTLDAKLAKNVASRTDRSSHRGAVDKDSIVSTPGQRRVS